MTQVAGMPCFSSSARMGAAPITPTSPRDTGVGVVMPRAIHPDIGSKSKLMQTMCFAITDASIDARAAFFRHSRPLLDVGLDEFAELLGRIADRLETETRAAFPDFGELQGPGYFGFQLRGDGLGRPRGAR